MSVDDGEGVVIKSRRYFAFFAVSIKNVFVLKEQLFIKVQ